MLSVKVFLANGVCWRVVRLHVTDHCIGQHQQLAGHGDDGYAGGLSPRLERGVKGLHAWAMPDGGDRRLIQPHTYLAASAPDVPRPRVRAAVVIEGGQADQRRDGLTVVPTQLRQIGEQGSGNLRPDARDRLQNLVAGLEGGGTVDDPVHALFQVLDLAFEVVDVLVDAREDLGRGLSDGRGVPLILLHGQHADELPAAVVKLAQVADFLGFQGTYRGGGDFAEVGDDGGIDGVGLGEVVHGFGEVAYLACVDDDGGESRG